MAYLIVSEIPTGMRKKQVTLYLEQAGEYRQIVDSAPIDLDVDAYVSGNFGALWASAEALTEAEYAREEDAQFDALYRAVVHAGMVAARGQLATLAEVSLAMETVILASPKAGAYTKLSTLGTAATAAERNRFLLVVAFIALSKARAG